MSRSFINTALIFSEDIEKGEINQMIYLLLFIYNSKKRTKSLLHIVRNNIIPHSRLFLGQIFLDTIGREFSKRTC